MRAGWASGFSRAEKWLVALFLLTLPLVNPWVRGDGVGYYAYLRSLLIDGDLRFENEWRAANASFAISHVRPDGSIDPGHYTSVGRLNNHFSVGPAMLWAPFAVLVHGVVLALNALGAQIPADGYSAPYVWTMAVATAAYGFAGLWLSFRLARRYFAERWAVLATLGLWLASSLPVYMYLNPSWSHAHSVFAVALFLWYWHRTRGTRRLRQWLVLGLLAGLMLNVYYLNAVFLLVPLVGSLRAWAQRLGRKPPEASAPSAVLLGNVVFGVALLVAFLPTFITKQIIYGSPFESGYGEQWFWTSPALREVLFSANHGLFSWTPVLLPAWLGLLFLGRRDGELALCLGAASLAFYYVVASYQNWAGLASFGNRFFISLTPVFVLGLTATLEGAARLLRGPRLAMASLGLALGLLILWNAGFIFQWATLMVPARGPVSWRQMAHNQVAVVPGKVLHTVRAYLFSRQALQQEIEQRDVERLRQASKGETN